MNKNFQEMFARAKQEKKGSLIGFATGMDPNYKTSKKILKEMAKHCGAIEVGLPFNTSTSDSSTIMDANMRAIKAGANTEKIFKLIKEVKSDYFSKKFFAQRPNSENLINGELNKRGLNFMRPWRQTLREYLKKSYKNYL